MIVDTKSREILSSKVQKWMEEEKQEGRVHQIGKLELWESMVTSIKNGGVLPVAVVKDIGRNYTEVRETLAKPEFRKFYCDITMEKDFPLCDEEKLLSTNVYNWLIKQNSAGKTLSAKGLFVWQKIAESLQRVGFKVAQISGETGITYYTVLKHINSSEFQRFFMDITGVEKFPSKIPHAPRKSPQAQSSHINNDRADILEQKIDALGVKIDTLLERVKA